MKKIEMFNPCFFIIDVNLNVGNEEDKRGREDGK